MENAPLLANGHQKSHLFLIITCAVVILGSVAAAYYFFYHQPSVTPTKASIPEVSKTTDIKNPVEFFYKNFSLKDYRVRITDKSSEGYTFYYEKGALIRVDGEGKYNNQTSSIIKNGKLYSINDADKTFVEMDLANPQSTYIISLYKVGSILDPILQRETPNATPWSLVSNNSTDKGILEYETKGRRLANYLPGNTDPVDIRFVLDANTGLISSASMKMLKGSEWKVMNFQYEEVSDIESLKTFPRDYKKVDPL